MQRPGELSPELESFYKGRRVCVTGGAGFIGGHLSRALRDLGARVAIIDDLSASDGASVDALLAEDPEQVQFIHGSILDKSAVQDALLGARTVFHLAALVSVAESFEQSERTFEVNVLGTLRTIEMARTIGAERVVAASSSSVYGDVAPPQSESMAPAPLSPYAVSKVATEHIIASWAKTLGIGGAALRLFNVYGPGQSEAGPYAAVIPSFLQRVRGGDPPVIYGDGSQTRDFVHISDVVRAFLLAGMREQAADGSAMNIGSGRATSIEDLAAIVSRLAGHPDLEPRYEAAREGEPGHSVADIAAAARLLDWRPGVDLETGLGQMLEQSGSTAVS